MTPANDKKLAVTVQRQVKSSLLPSVLQLKQWARSTLSRYIAQAEITIRITDAAEMTALNHTWRGKKKPTNVLSFPILVPKAGENNLLLGDIVLCAEVVFQEAAEQHKTIEAHFAHMIVHGTLHLIGFDHENSADAEKMESAEIFILNQLGFKNPYASNEK